MNKDTVVTLVLLNGAELVGRFVSQDDDNITVNKPRLIAPQERGLAFVPGITMTGVEPSGDFDFPRHSVLYMVATKKIVADSWQSAVSGVEMPKQAGLIGL